jgi:hypothetical protein
MKTLTKSFFPAMVLMTSIFPGILNGQSDPQRSLPQFRYDKFSNGIIKMKDGRMLKAVLDYNMIDEEMVFKQGAGYMVLDKPLEIDTVYLEGARFVPQSKCFLQVVWGGPVSVYIQNKAKYTQVPTTTAYGIKSPTNATINITSVQGGTLVRHLEIPENVTVSDASVYWIGRNNNMERFTNERQLLKLFPDRETEIKDFIKTTKIDIKTPEGLTKLGAFINGIK